MIGFNKLKKPDAPPEVFTRSASIFKPDPNILYEYDYLFEDVQIKDDCSFGQRNYERNLEPLLAQLLGKRKPAKPPGKKKDDLQS